MDNLNKECLHSRMFIELEYHEIEIILKMLTRDFMEIGNPISIQSFKNKFPF